MRTARLRFGMDKKPAIGLALGGGGARGLAHVGLLKVLEREQIPVAFIAGTSMGGLVGSLYAAGIPLHEVSQEIGRLSKLSEQLRLVDVGLGAGGLSVRGRRVYNFMADLLGEQLTFADLHIPFAVTSVDLETGRDIVIQGGLVIDAVRATISVPGVFTPVELGDFRLVDGGVLNNLPVDVARSLGEEPVVAVDVLPSFAENWPGQPPTETGLRLDFVRGGLHDVYSTLMIMIAALTEYKLGLYPPDLLLRPVLPSDVGLLVGFHRADELISAGEQAAEAVLPQLRRSSRWGTVACWLFNLSSAT